MDVSPVNQFSMNTTSTGTPPVSAAEAGTSIEMESTQVNTSNVQINAAINTQANQDINKAVNANEKPVDPKELNKAMERLNKFVEDDNISFEYSVHPQFKDTLIKIVDKTTGETITEIPPKKILDMVAKMCELAGIVFDKKV